MLIWLVPISLFWAFAALYLGGMNVEFHGGSGLRQVLGLFTTFALFMLIWYGARMALSGLGLVPGEIILPTLIAILTLPLSSRLGFGLFGTRIQRGEATGH